jgi:hypothetical protein
VITTATPLGLWVPMRNAGSQFCNFWAMRGMTPRAAMCSAITACHEDVAVEFVLFFRDDQRVQQRVYIKTRGVLSGWLGEHQLDDGSLATKCPNPTCGGPTKTSHRSVASMGGAVCANGKAQCWRGNKIARPPWIELLAQLPERIMLWEVEFPLRPVYDLPV